MIDASLFTVNLWQFNIVGKLPNPFLRCQARFPTTALGCTLRKRGLIKAELVEEFRVAIKENQSRLPVG